MRSKSMRRNRDRGRTSGGLRFLLEERRRLLQLGVSLAVLVFAMVGRSALPGRTEKWSEFLVRDIDLSAALTRFEESTAGGEPFLDALGELCIEVFTAEEGADEERPELREKRETEQKLGPAERYRIWDEFRESQWQADERG